jgi:hypothetical protein
MRAGGWEPLPCPHSRFQANRAFDRESTVVTLLSLPKLRAVLTRLGGRNRQNALVPSRPRTRLSRRSLRPLLAFLVFSAIGIAIPVSGRHGLRASVAVFVCALVALAAALWGLSLALSSRGQDQTSESR